MKIILEFVQRRTVDVISRWNFKTPTQHFLEMKQKKTIKFGFFDQQTNFRGFPKIKFCWKIFFQMTHTGKLSRHEKKIHPK